MTFRLSCWALLMASLIAGSSAFGQSKEAAKFDAAGCIQTVSPFVEAETFAVAHMDLSRISAETLGEVYRSIPFPPNASAPSFEDVTHHLQAWQQAGCKELYLVFSHNPQVPRINQQISAIFPGANEEAVRKLVPKSVQDHWHAISNAMVFTFFEQKAPTFKPVDRPELKTAFETTGDSAIQVAVIPPASTRRVLEELSPDLPKEIGGGPVTVFTHGIQWAALAIDLPPHIKINLAIQSQDAKAAEALHAKIVALLQLAGKVKEVRAAVPDYDVIAEIATPKVENDRLVLKLDEKDQKLVQVVGDFTTTQIRAAQGAALQTQGVNNLKEIALGMLNHESAHATYPAQANVGPDGKPLLSWRVHILPYLGLQDLYKQFHLDEPWDSEHNRALIGKMPSVYHCPISKNKTSTGLTNYLVPCGPGTVFENFKPTKIPEITDGTSDTILALEVDDDQAVIWTKPEDWTFNADSPLKGLGHLYGRPIILSAFCDGSVHIISTSVNPKVFRNLIEKADGNAVDHGAY